MDPRFREDDIIVDDETLRARKIGPETRVRIAGEVERDRRGLHVDVERLEVVS